MKNLKVTVLTKTIVYQETVFDGKKYVTSDLKTEIILGSERVTKSNAHKFLPDHVNTSYLIIDVNTRKEVREIPLDVFMENSFSLTNKDLEVGEANV